MENKKQKPKRVRRRKYRFAKNHGGAIFASVVFIVLSMMVISQGDRATEFEKTLGFTLKRSGASAITAEQRQAQITELQQDVAASDARFSMCKEDQAAYLTKMQRIAEEKDLGIRLLDMVVLKKVGLQTPVFTPAIILNRPSPSGAKTAVIIGKKTATSTTAFGFFIRDNDGILDDGVLYGTGESSVDLGIKNVRWQDEKTITYDRELTGPAPGISHETYILK